MSDMDAVLRPALRGSLHRWSVPVAIGCTVVLALRVPTGGSRAAVIVYGGCVTAMLAVSATYHAARLFDRDRRILRRVDHSTILVGIAGTYTGVIVLALEGGTRVVLLVAAWTIAAAGVAIRMLWFDAPAGVVAAVYLLAGWMIVLDLPAYVDALSRGELAWLAVGGACYTAGALVYALKRPDPWPAVFGFHELFHALVVAGALAQWLAVFSLTG
jgi:hemolysin III